MHEQLKGQHELRSLLSAALKTGRLSHAVMLIGPAGSGKTSWGRLLAQALLCPHGEGLKPCNACSSCRNFLSSRHPEFYYLAPETKVLKVDQFDDVRRRFYLSGAKKVCLIDRAETMNTEAASSLLKILEEPPEGLTFILLVEQPRAVFDTILSRCSRYYLLPLGCEEIYQLLLSGSQARGEKARIVARLSAGLPGYAFKMAADEGFDERLREAKTLAYNMSVSRSSALELLNWAGTLAERDDLVLLLELVALIYREALMQNFCSGSAFIFETEKAYAWTASVSSQALEEAVLLLNQALVELVKTNVNRRLLLEKTLIVWQRRFA